MASASSEGSVFFYDYRPSSKFAVIGHLGMLLIISARTNDDVYIE